MKTAILLILLSVGLSAQENTFKNDTIPSLMMVEDTSGNYNQRLYTLNDREYYTTGPNGLFWVKGYVVKECYEYAFITYGPTDPSWEGRVSCGEEINLLGYGYEGGKKTVGYLNRSKHPIPKQWVVFTHIEIEW